MAQLTLPDPLPSPVLATAREAMASAGCPELADNTTWRERARGWMEKYRRRARRWPDEQRRRVEEIRAWLASEHNDDPSRNEWIRIAMIEQALEEMDG